MLCVSERISDSRFFLNFFVLYTLDGNGTETLSQYFFEWTIQTYIKIMENKKIDLLKIDF